MTKAVADILRQKRADCLRDAAEQDRAATNFEGSALAARRAAQQNRELHVQLGNAIRMIEGDQAKLDLPHESFS